MTLDATTEIIAHFIGRFEIVVDGDRLRDAYREFDLNRPDPESLGELAPLSVRLKAPQDLEPYDPGLSYQPPAPPPSPGPPSPGKLDGVYPGGRPPYPDVALPELRLNQNIEMPSSPPSTTPATLPAELREGDLTLAFEVPLPGSVVTYTGQSALLHDDDLFGTSSNAAFRDTAELHAAFSGMVEDTASLSAFEAPSPFEDDWAPFAAEAIARTQSSPPSSAIDGLEVHVKHGADATGVLVDGERLEKLPTWSDFLPAYLKGDRERDEAEQEGSAEGVSQGEASIADPASTASTGVSSVAAAVEAHSAEPSAQGATVLVPKDDFQDAFSRAFEGQERDTKQGPLRYEPGHEIVAGGNTTVNEVTIKSSWLDAPVFVVRGNVVKVEAVSQVNVLIEHDKVRGGDDDPLSTVMNAAEIVSTSAPYEADQEPFALPQNWHVARISADVLNVNWVEQKTFVTDFDRAVVESVGSSTYLVLGENEIVNSTNIAELGFFYDVIFVGKDMIDVTMVSQTNLLFDSDEITAASGIAGNVSAADNLLYNQTVLRTKGIDTIVEMKANFAQAAEELAAGAETLAQDVAQDAFFQGMEFLRALWIDGSFVTANVLKQENLVGDADRIKLEMEALGDNLQFQIVAGSNALVNLASIEKFGIDSKIMTAGQVYQEAMLYQAELIDRDALPTGVGLQPLAQEAVAFLADGMIAPEKGKDVVQIAAEPEAPSVDLMQTMVS